MSSNQFLQLAEQTTEAEMTVPNTSMIGGSGFMPPNNSVCYPSATAANIMSGSVSDEMLSDKLVQVALYQQMDAPPSQQAGGDTSPARSTFDDIDFAHQGKVPFRHIVRLLKAEDAILLANLTDPATLLDFSEFVSFLETAYSARKHAREAQQQ